MTREVAPNVYALIPGEMIVYTNSFGCKRYYKILSVMIGALGGESWVEVESAQNPSVPLNFPVVFLESAIQLGHAQIYEG